MKFSESEAMAAFQDMAEARKRLSFAAIKIYHGFVVAPEVTETPF
jgi:hypothetical protein